MYEATVGGAGDRLSDRLVGRHLALPLFPVTLVSLVEKRLWLLTRNTRGSKTCRTLAPAMTLASWSPRRRRSKRSPKVVSRGSVLPSACRVSAALRATFCAAWPSHGLRGLMARRRHGS